MKTLAWLIGGALLVLVLTIGGIAAALVGGVLEFGELPTITLNGEVLDLAGLGVEHAVAAAVALVVALVVVCTVVPLALVVAGIVVAAALGLAALAVGSVALLVFSPAILIGFLIWRALRRTTIAA